MGCCRGCAFIQTDRQTDRQTSSCAFVHTCSLTVYTCVHIHYMHAYIHIYAEQSGGRGARSVHGKVVDMSHPSIYCGNLAGAVVHAVGKRLWSQLLHRQMCGGWRRLKMVVHTHGTGR